MHPHLLTVGPGPLQVSAEHEEQVPRSGSEAGGGKELRTAERSPSLLSPPSGPLVPSTGHGTERTSRETSSWRRDGTAVRTELEAPPEPLQPVPSCFPTSLQPLASPYCSLCLPKFAAFSQCPRMHQAHTHHGPFTCALYTGPLHVPSPPSWSPWLFLTFSGRSSLYSVCLSQSIKASSMWHLPQV